MISTWNTQKANLWGLKTHYAGAAFQDNTSEISDKEINYFVHFVMSFLSINEKTHQKLVTETAKNDTLQKLRHQISAGWEEHRLKLDSCLRPYYHHNSMITY